MRLSAVVPLFNKEATIARCLGAIFAQSRVPDEVIVVDDGSTDGSAAIVRGFARPGLTLLRQPNAGVSAARNRGIAAASGDLVLLCDADDEWLPDHAATLLAAHRAAPGHDLYTTLHAVRAGGAEVAPRHVAGADYLAAQLRGRGMIHSSSVAIRRAGWARFAGFPVGVRSGEDHAVWRAIDRAGPIRFVDRCTVIVHKAPAAAAAGRGDAIPAAYDDAALLADPRGRRYLRRHMRRRLLVARVFGSRTVAEDIAARGLLGPLELRLLGALGAAIGAAGAFGPLHRAFRRLKALGR
jgi:glycosyltransferase involved in cell wall biosynthesis